MSMKLAAVLPSLVVAFATWPALAQPAREGPQGVRPMPRSPQQLQRPMPQHQPPPGRMTREEQRKLREDLRSANRDVSRNAQRSERAAVQGNDETRRREVEGLLEQVRGGQMTRDEAIRQYIERFGLDATRYAEAQRLREAVREGHMSPQEAREQMREKRTPRASESGRLTPKEREQLRRDMSEAKRDLPRP